LPQPNLAKGDVTDPLDLLYWPDGPGREGARVPVPWTANGTDHHGFTAGMPWLPMAWNGDIVQRGLDVVRPFYREVIGLRRDHDWAGAQVITCEANGDVLNMTIQTQTDQRFRGVFSHGAGQPVNCPDTEPLFRAEPDDAQGWFGAIWQV